MSLDAVGKAIRDTEAWTKGLLSVRKAPRIAGIESVRGRSYADGS